MLSHMPKEDGLYEGNENLAEASWKSPVIDKTLHGSGTTALCIETQDSVACCRLCISASLAILHLTLSLHVRRHVQRITLLAILDSRRVGAMPHCGCTSTNEWISSTWPAQNRHHETIRCGCRDVAAQNVWGQWWWELRAERLEG